MRRSKALALVFLVGTLVVGGAAGFTVDRMLVRDACQKSSDRGSLREYLDAQLHLTQLQHAQVDSILDKRHRDMSAVFDLVRPRLDSIRVSARGEIFKVLDPQQDSLFQQLIDESKRDDSKRETKQQ